MAHGFKGVVLFTTMALAIYPMWLKKKKTTVDKMYLSLIHIKPKKVNYVITGYAHLR